MCVLLLLRTTPLLLIDWDVCAHAMLCCWCCCCRQAEKELAGINSRLHNPKFMSKASPEYVAEVQGQAAEAADRLASITAKLAQVEALQT